MRGGLSVCGESFLRGLDGRIDTGLAGFVDVPDGLPVLRPDQIEAIAAGGNW